MAKCVKNQVVVVPPPAEYVLTLTEDEANVLKTILGQFNWNGPTDVIYNALARAGAMTIGRVERLRAEAEGSVGTLKFQRMRS